MSGGRGREGSAIPARGEVARGISSRAQLPLLDRLIDEAPESARDPALSATEAMAVLRRAVRRDLEALLNAHRRFRSVPPQFAALKTSPLTFGIPDYTAGTFADPRARERLRREVEATIRRFEPRFASIGVALLNAKDTLDATLRLRIEALLHAEPAPEPVAFDTEIETTAAEVMVREKGDV